MVLEGLGRSLDPNLDILEIAKPLLLKNLLWYTLQWHVNVYLSGPDANNSLLLKSGSLPSLRGQTTDLGAFPCTWLKCSWINNKSCHIRIGLKQRFSIPVLAPPRSAYFACLSLLTHLIQIISSLEVRSVHELCSDWHAPYTGSIAPYTGSIAPYTGSIAPYTGSIAPYTVSIAPYTVSIALYTGSIAPYTVSIAPYTVSIAPYTGSIAPYTGSIAPYTGSIAPYTGSIAPYTGSIAPYTVSIVPYTGSIAPYTGSIAPYTGSIAPYTGSIAPHTGSIAPYTGSIAPYTGSIAPYTVSIAPYTGSIAPYTGSIAPYTGFIAPYTGSIAPYTGSIAPYSLSRGNPLKFTLFLNIHSWICATQRLHARTSVTSYTSENIYNFNSRLAHFNALWMEYIRSLRAGIMAEYLVMSTSQGTYVPIEQTSEAIRVTYEICRAGGREDWNWEPLD